MGLTEHRASFAISLPSTARAVKRMAGVTVTANNGSVGGTTVNSDNQVVYSAGTVWTGVDSFTYTVADAAGTQATGTVNVRIVAVDPLGNNADDNGGGSAGSGGNSGSSGSGSPPPGSAGSGDPGGTGGDPGTSGGDPGTSGGGILTEPPITADVTENTTGTVNLSTTWPYVEVTSPPANGTLISGEVGSFGYKPNLNFTGSDSFTYVGYDYNWNAVTGTVTINVTPGYVVPDPVKPVPPSDPGTATTGDPNAPADPNPTIVDVGETYTSGKFGVTVSNNSDGPIVVGFSAHDASFLPYGTVKPNYDVDVSGVNGYADAAWTGPEVKTLTIDATGSIAGVDLPGTDIWFDAGNGIGDVTGGDVFEDAGLGVGKVVATGSAAIDAGGGVPSVTAKDDVYYVLAGGDVGPVDAETGAIGVLFASGDLTGKIHAVDDIGSITGFSLTADVVSDSGSIGFGETPEYGGDLETFDPSVYNGVRITTKLSGSIEAPNGNIELVYGYTVTSPAIKAEGRIDMVIGGYSISSTQITSNEGTVYSVTAGRGGITNATIYAYNDIGGDMPDTFQAYYFPLGEVLLADGVGSAGPISGCTINAAVAVQDASEADDSGGESGDAGALGSGNIDTVSALDISGTTINAAGYIQLVAAGNSIAGTIKAGGNIGQICTSHFGNWGYAQGLAQDVSANITAGGDIRWIYVGRDLSGAVKAVNLPNVRVDRNLTGKITATGDIGSVYVQRSATAAISGNTIGKVLVGYNLSGNVTSNNAIDGVSVGHTLSGNITAKAGGINVVAAGAVLLATPGVLDGYWTFAQTGAGTNQGSIQGATIKATGDIQWVSAVAGLGYGGDIKGATISAEDIGTVLTSGNLDATITATGSIGSVWSGRGGVSAGFVAAPPLTYANDGDISGTIKAGTSIGSVAANGSPFDPGVGSIEATITAGTDIGGLTATYDISGSVTAGHSLTGGVSAGRDITGAITATSGSISGATAGRDIDGALSAGQNIGNVTAGGNIGGNITAGATFNADGTQSKTDGVANVTSGSGNIGNVTAGTGPTGGDIAGDLKAGGSIGNVFAGGSADEKDISSLDTPADLIGNGYEWWLNIDQADDTYTVDKPAGEPAPDGGGDIAGTISAGLTLGMVTAYGTISQALSAVQSIGSVWALGDIDGSITSGTGALNVSSWESINGALTAAGSIAASAFDDLAGAVTSTLGGVNLTSWGDIAGAVQSQLNITLWALNNIASPSIISNFGAGAFTAFNNLIGCNVLVNTPVVHMALNITNCTFTSNPAAGIASFMPGPAMIFAFNNITNTTIDVSKLPGNAAMPNPFGYVLVVAGGSVTGSTIKASIGVDLLAGGNATSDTIDTMAGATFAAALQAGGGILSTLGPQALSSLLNYVGQLKFVTQAWGTMLTGLGNEVGFVNVLVQGNTNATVNSPTVIDVETFSVAGTYNGANVSIDAWNGASFGNVEGTNAVEIFVNGTLSGPIDSSNGTVSIEASGNVSSNVTGTWSVAIDTAGGCTGSVTSSQGPVAIDAFAAVTGAVSAKVYADVTSWTGPVSGSINTSGYAKVCAGGDSSGNITAGGNVVLVTFGDETGTVIAGNGNTNALWSADIDAEGDVQGQVTAPGDVTIDANGDISSQVTAQQGSVVLDAAGDVSSSTIEGSSKVTVLGADGVDIGDVTSQAAGLFVRSGAGLEIGDGNAATSASVLAGGTASATLTITQDFGSATVIAPGDITANITGNSVTATVTSGGDADVSVQGPSGGDAGSGPKTVSVVAVGSLAGSVQQAGTITLMGWGGVSGFTASAIYSLSVTSGGSLDGTFNSIGDLWAEAQGAVDGTYYGSTGAVTVIGEGSVDGEISNASSGLVTVLSRADVDASISANWDTNVTAGGGVSGAITARDDANVSALGGAVSGTVTAQNDANLLAKQGVTAAVWAAQDATVTALGAITGSITANAGGATVNDYGTLSGAVKAGTTASVYADQAAGKIEAGGNATVVSEGTIDGDITAGGDADIKCGAGIVGDIQATGSANVFAMGDISGTVTATNGDASIEDGAELSGDVTAGGNLSAVALGALSSVLLAGRRVTVTGWSDVTGNITAQGGDATLNVNGGLTGSVNASGSVTANVVNDVSGDLTAGDDVTVNTGGELSGNVQAGGDASVTSAAECSGQIAAVGDADIESLGDVTSEIAAGGNVDIETWSNINSQKVGAGGSVSLWAAGNLEATVTATAGSIDAGTSGTTQMTATANGDISLKSLGAVSSTSLTSEHGAVDVDVHDGATLTVKSSGDATLFVSGDLNGTVTTTDGAIDAETLGALSGTYTAGGDADVNALGDASGVTVSANENAQLTTLGDATNVSVSGESSADVWAGGTLSGTITSNFGEATTFAIGEETVLVDAALSISVEGLDDVQANVASGLDTTVFSLGNLNATVTAGTGANVQSGGDLTANVTAANNVAMAAAGNLTGTGSAGGNLEAGAFGNLNATNFHAAGDVTLIWARGDVTGNISADGNIDEVDSYGSVNASLSANSVGTITAYGSIGGTITSTQAVGTLDSGQAVTATINAPSVGSIVQNDAQAMTDYPATPTFNDAADIANRNAAVAGLNAVASQIATDDQGALASLAAGKAAAAPLFQVSIGDLGLATAAFENAGIALASLMADGQNQAEEALAGAQTSLTTFFNAEDARLLVAKTNAQGFVKLVQTTVAQVTADREAAAASDKAAAAAIVQAASTGQAEYLQKLNYTRDVEWPTLFQDRFRAQLVDRLQTVLEVAGIFDPTGIADGANGLIYWVNGDTFNAKISFAGAIVPYFGDVAKTLKLGKYADDGLEAIRRVADDFFGLAGRVFRHGDNACEAATALGAANKAQGFSEIVGCFVTDTMAGGRSPIPSGAPIIVQAESSYPLAMSEDADEHLWACLFATVAVGGWWIANRRLRRKEAENEQRRAATSALFAHGADSDGPVDDEQIDLIARFVHGNEDEAVLRLGWDASIRQVTAAGWSNPAGILPMPLVFATPATNRRSAPRRLQSRPRKERIKVRSTTITSMVAPSRPNTARRHRQSRFGLIWLGVFLCLAAWSAIRVPAGPRQPSAFTANSLMMSTASGPETIDARMKPIQNYRMGERLVVTNPLGGAAEGEPDAETWRSVELRMRKPSGKWLEMSLIQPPQWLESEQPRPGRTVQIDLPEIGVSGRAQVLSVGPCPEIQPGEGCVVTGIFRHESDGNLVNVWLEGIRKPLGVTDNHPFFSNDRSEFVVARNLRPGEQLVGIAPGKTVRVAYITPRVGDEIVYNLRVAGQHVYHVGELGALVHNTCPTLRKNEAFGLGSTANLSKGTTLARNLREQLAIEQAMANPNAGRILLDIPMGDPRWHGSNGWVKMEQIIDSGGREGPITVHYVFNLLTGDIDDFKIVLPGKR